MQQAKYCRDCGQELKPEDKFCAGCGRSVYDTAPVPTPEADVPVPPTPKQVEDSPQLAPRAAQQEPSPPPQPQQRLGRWDQFKGQIFLFLGSVILTSLADAATEPKSGQSAGYFIGLVIGSAIILLINYGLIWLALGGVGYLVARRQGKNPAFLHVLFDWRLTIVVATVILVVGLLFLLS